MGRTSVSNKPTDPVQPAGSERRITTRHECDGFAEVLVPFKGLLFRGEIANLSELGCYVKTRARLSLRRSVEVELRFTVRGDNFSVLASSVAVRNGDGAGFEFSLIDPPMHRKLLELIEELRSCEVASQAETASS